MGGDWVGGGREGDGGGGRRGYSERSVLWSRG